jgi:spore germination cell wall hydrolase CwlJ-like protein
MLNKLLAVFAAGMLSFSTPLQAAEMPGTLPVVSETTPTIAPVIPAVVRTETDVPLEAKSDSPEVDDSQAACVARAMYFEARGESLKGKKAVGYVVLNRANSPRWASTPCKVIAQPHQFSWYRPYKKIPTKLKSYYVDLAKTLIESYSRANDPTGGATFFHAKYVNPGWRGVKRLLSIGGHIFYR